MTDINETALGMAIREAEEKGYHRNAAPVVFAIRAYLEGLGEQEVGKDSRCVELLPRQRWMLDKRPQQAVDIEEGRSDDKKIVKFPKGFAWETNGQIAELIKQAEGALPYLEENSVGYYYYWMLQELKKVASIFFTVTERPVDIEEGAKAIWNLIAPTQGGEDGTIKKVPYLMAGVANQLLLVRAAQACAAAWGLPPGATFPVSNDESRAEFERWHSSVFEEELVWLPERNLYRDFGHQQAWRGWQANSERNVTERR